MGFGGHASMPAPQIPPPPPAPATMASASIQQAGSAQRAAMLAASGLGGDNTITNTGGMTGISSSSVPAKQKLGD